jgi:hypothetical protein
MDGKYTLAQAMRFRLVGARKFLRYPEDKFPGTWMLGDATRLIFKHLPDN